MQSNSAVKFITEDYLLSNFGMRIGGEIVLTIGTKFTPSAKQLIDSRGISIRWQDEKGQVFVEEFDKGKGHSVFKKVHPLKTNNIKPENNCLLCGSDVVDKPALMTHLNDKLLVPKTHPRIFLRGKLDLCISYCTLVQIDMLKEPALLTGFLADIRSYLGEILKAEVMENALPELFLGEFSSSDIHRWSHNPLKYLGHDHILPDVAFGSLVGKLNYLRALIRELELVATQTFIDHSLQLNSGGVDRSDIISGLNRLSSAVYVIQILVLQCKNGQESVLKGLNHDVA